MNFCVGIIKTAAAPGIPLPKPTAAPTPVPAFTPQPKSNWNPSMKQFPRKAPAEPASSITATTNNEMGIR